MELDDVVPRPDHVTRQVRWIAAEPAAVWDALHGVRLSGLPLTLALSAARFLPVVLSGRGRGQLRDRPFLDALPVPLLESEPPSSVVFGGLLQPWHLARRRAGAGARRRGAARLGRAGLGEGRHGLPARPTRRRHGALLRDPGARPPTTPAARRSRRYWRVIRHGSTAVRWEVLTAVELRATG